MARPSSFKQATADTICERIANGESLRAICKSPTMPTTTTVKRWLAKTEPEEFVAFRAQYVRAREDQADALFDEILDIADEKAADVRRAQLRVDARKWMAGKLQPKKYGERLALDGKLTHAADATITGLLQRIATQGGRLAAPTEET